MDSYAARLILAAVLLAGATFSASCFGEAKREADSEPPCTTQTVQTQTAQDTQTEQTYSTALPCAAAPEEQTPVQEELWQTTYLTALRTPSLPAGTEVTVFGTAGEELQCVLTQENGYAGLQPLPPGYYTVWTKQLGAAYFRLRDNASVEARGGGCWSDGELLHLIKSAALKVECSLKREEASELRLTLQNEADGASSEQVLCFATAGLLRTQRTAFFADLSTGSYRLLVNGILWKEIEINDTPIELKMEEMP